MPFVKHGFPEGFLEFAVVGTGVIGDEPARCEEIPAAGSIPEVREHAWCITAARPRVASFLLERY